MQEPRAKPIAEETAMMAGNAVAELMTAARADLAAAHGENARLQSLLQQLQYGVRATVSSPSVAARHATEPQPEDDRADASGLRALVAANPESRSAGRDGLHLTITTAVSAGAAVSLQYHLRTGKPVDKLARLEIRSSGGTVLAALEVPATDWQRVTMHGMLHSLAPIYVDTSTVWARLKAGCLC